MSPETTRLQPLRSLARRLGVPLAWLRREAEAGRIPALRAGQTYLCDAEAIESILLERARRLPPRQEVPRAAP